MLKKSIVNRIIIVGFIMVYIFLSNSLEAQIDTLKVEDDVNLLNRIQKIIDEKTEIKLANNLLIKKNGNLEDELKAKEILLEHFEKMINDRNKALDELNDLLNNKEDFFETSKITDSLVVETLRLDSLEKELKIASLTKDKGRLLNVYQKLKRSSSETIQSLLNELLSRTFEITATVKNGFFKDNPDAPLPLDSLNSYKIRNKTILKVEINFSLGGPKVNLTNIIPKYRYDLYYIDRKGQNKSLLVNDEEIIVREGRVKNVVPIIKGDIKKGIYEFILKFEENQKIKSIKHTFYL